jgi:hypothetical protein
MDNDISAVFERTQENRSRNCVVDNQGYTVLVRDSSQTFDIGNISGRIAHALAINRARVFVDQLRDLFRMISFGEAAFDSALWKNVREKGVGCPVKLGRGDDVRASLGNVDQRILDGSHSGADAERLYAALKSRHAFFKDGIGGVADTSVDVALDIQIEQGCAVFRAFELKGDSLVDGDGNRLCGGVAVIANVNRDGFSLHFCGFYYRELP